MVKPEDRGDQATACLLSVQQMLESPVTLASGAWPCFSHTGLGPAFAPLQTGLGRWN